MFDVEENTAVPLDARMPGLGFLANKLASRWHSGEISGYDIHGAHFLSGDK